jgi:sporulation protein YlmC with PRC-barrel domain
VELNGKRGAFSQLIGRPVVDQSGRSLGRVYEARARVEGDGAVVIEELLVGRRALWWRLRGPGPDAHGIAWESVAELAEDRIVVRAG